MQQHWTPNFLQPQTNEDYMGAQHYALPNDHKSNGPATWIWKPHNHHQANPGNTLLENLHLNSPLSRAKQSTLTIRMKFLRNLLAPLWTWIHLLSRKLKLNRLNLQQRQIQRRDVPCGDSCSASSSRMKHNRNKIVALFSLPRYTRSW